MALSKRNNSLDLLRILSCVSVIIIHCNAHYFIDNSTPPVNLLNSPDYIIQSILNIATRFSVPCFIMISGAFILSNKDNSDLKAFYCKSMYKTFFPMIPIAFVLYLAYGIKQCVFDHEYLKPIKMVFLGNQFSYWFMYMLLFIYILTPFILIIKQNITKRAYEISAVFMMIWACISQILSSQKSGITIGVVFAFISYYMIGNIIYENVYNENNEKQSNPTKYLCISFVMIVITFIARFLGSTYYLFNAFVSFFSPTIIVLSICVFRAFCSIKLKKDLSFFSSQTFYMYLLHETIILIMYYIIE